MNSFAIDGLKKSKKCSDSSHRPFFPNSLRNFTRSQNGANLFGRFIRINGIPAWGADYKQPCSLIFEDGHRTVLCPNPGFLCLYYTQPQIQVFLIQKNLKMQCVCMQQDMAATKSLQSGHLSKRGCTANIKKYLDKLQNGDYQLVDVVEGVLTDITFNVD